MIRIVLADDHVMVRRGLCVLLQTQADFAIVGETASGQQTIELVRQLQPNVLVLDMALPDLHGLEVLRRVKQESVQTHVAILSMYGDEAYVLQSLRDGAEAYILKESGAEQLVQAVRDIMTDRHYLSPPLFEYVIKAYRQCAQVSTVPADPYETLSPREREVLHHLIDGRSSREIAAKLSISRRTVDTHRLRLMQKVGAKTQAELIQQASRRPALLRWN
jgi:DNA-binding NarL/FixJ family response regulator